MHASRFVVGALHPLAPPGYGPTSSLYTATSSFMKLETKKHAYIRETMHITSNKKYEMTTVCYD